MALYGCTLFGSSLPNGTTSLPLYRLCKRAMSSHVYFGADIYLVVSSLPVHCKGCLQFSLGRAFLKILAPLAGLACAHTCVVGTLVLAFSFGTVRVVIGHGFIHVI